MPGYQGTLAISGSYLFRQSGAQLIGQYHLNGMESSSMGMFHVHTGSSCRYVYRRYQLTLSPFLSLSSPGAHLMNDQSAAHVHDQSAAHGDASHQNMMNGGMGMDMGQRRLAVAGEAAHPLPTVGSAATSNGNTVCTPCVAGITYSAKQDSAQCMPLTPCAVGTYETVAGTSTTDRVCSACTNAPENAVFTSAGSTISDCIYECADGFRFTNADTECSAIDGSAELKLRTASGTGSLTLHTNNVLQFTGFTCVDAPEFCGAGSVAAMRADITALKAEVQALQNWARSISAWAQSQGFSGGR